jgi:hypothetical protein
MILEALPQALSAWPVRGYMWDFTSVEEVANAFKCGAINMT